jgi:hypothetical protein
MRWREILFESVKKYAPMFSMFADEKGTTPAWVAQRIKAIESLLHREDRVVWALRWERYAALLTDKYPVRGDRDALQAKMERELGPNVQRELEAYITMRDEHFQHWLSLPIAAIQNHVFVRQQPFELWNEFVEFEEEWAAKRKQVLRHDEYEVNVAFPEREDDDPTNDDEDYYDRREREKSLRKRALNRKGNLVKVLDFGDGWAWWNLDRPSCRKEGDAMGHCGNTANPQPGDTILSLRKDLGEGQFRPSLTFILHEDGMLGEMKGRANDKPKAAYHKMIAALLEQPFIKGARGGGYASQNNFSIFDLDEAEREKLLKEKPLLETLYDCWHQFQKAPAHKPTKDRLVSRLTQDIKNNGFSLYEIRFQHVSKPLLILDAPTTTEKLCREHWTLGQLDDFFEELADTWFERYPEVKTRDEAEALADEARERYFQDLFDELLYYGADQFILHGVAWRAVADDKYAISMPVADYINPSSDDLDEDDARPPFEQISDLDDTQREHTGFYWSDVEANLTNLDETAMLVARYVISERAEDRRPAEDEMFRAVNIKADEITHFSDDPRQMAFPFYKKPNE